MAVDDSFDFKYNLVAIKTVSKSQLLSPLLLLSKSNYTFECGSSQRLILEFKSMGASWELFEKMRIAKGVTAYQIAKECGISQSVLSNWKAGRFTPKEDKIKKLAAYFDVPVSYFYGGEDEEPPKYYLNEETAAMAQQLFDDPDLRMLFDAAKDCAPDQLKLAAEILRKFKETNPDG